MLNKYYYIEILRNKMSYTCQVKSIDIYDEKKWLYINGLRDITVNHIKYINGNEYAATNSGIFKSNDLCTWIATPINEAVKFIDYINGFFTYIDNNNEVVSKTLAIMIKSNNQVITTFDMFNFETYTIDLFNDKTITGLCTYNNVFYVVGNNGFLASSSNGYDWEQINLGYGKNFNSIISSDSQLIIVGDDGLILISEDLSRFDEFNLGVSDNLKGIINSSLGFNIIWSDTNAFLTDLNTITTPATMEDSSNIKDIVMNQKGVLFLLHTNNVIEYTEEYSMMNFQVYEEKEAYKLLLNDNSLYCFGSNVYKKYNDKGNRGLYNILLSKSEYVREVIVKQIVVSCYATDDDEFIGEDGTVNSGMTSVSLQIVGDGYTYNLISPDSELLGGENMFILKKPLILNEGERIEFMSIFPKACATIYYILGD